MAKTVNPFLEEDHPPFPGYTADVVKFLKALARNNTREWFAENKQRYEDSVRYPTELLLATLGERLRKGIPDIVIDPKRSIFRINRDVRFSQDKSPYKTSVAASFTFSGFDRKTGPCFYFHITPEETGMGGGLYMPSGDQLKKLRAAVDRDSAPLKRILANKGFDAMFGGLMGDSLVRVPQGYDKEHPDAELLRRKQFFSWASFAPEEAVREDFVDVLEKHMRTVEPLVRWVCAAVR